MSSAAKRWKGNEEVVSLWNPDPSTAAEDRASDAARMGEIAEGIKFMYESGQLTDATFTERQRNISEYVAAAIETRPGILVETIVSFIMYGAGLSLTVPNGQLYMSDMICYVAANFYARAPRWESRVLDSVNAMAAEVIAHLRNRFSPYESLQRYELDTVNYDALWANVNFGGQHGFAQKIEIEKLLASGIGFTENLHPITRVSCEIEVGPPLLQGTPYFQAPGAKWSCGGPPVFSFNDEVTEIPIFNRQLGKKLPLMQTVLFETGNANPERVRAWLQECGSAKEISSQDDANAVRDTLFASTSEELQPFLGISAVAARMAHKQLKGPEGMALLDAIGRAHQLAIENRSRGRKTLRWQAELMVLYSLYEGSREYPQIYLGLDDYRKNQATDRVLRGVIALPDTGPQYPQYQGIIDHYNIRVADVDAQLGMFPPIVREILSAERDVTRLFHLRVGRDRHSAIREMLAIDHGLCDRNSHYWLSDNLLQMITDWYMHCSLVASNSATMRTTIDRDMHKGIQKALTSIFNHKVSLEVMNDAKGVLAPFSRAPDADDDEALPLTSVADGIDVVPFLNAVFQPLHNRRKRPERLDVFDLTFTALLDKLETIDDADLSRYSLQELPADTPGWIKYEYGSGDYGDPVYDIFGIFRSRNLMGKLLILCGHNKHNVKMVINALKAYHANGLSVRAVAYTKFAKMLLEIQPKEELPTSDDEDDYGLPPDSQDPEKWKAEARALQAKIRAMEAAMEATDDLLKELEGRIEAWLYTYGAQPTPLAGYVDADARENRLVAFLLILSGNGGRHSVDSDHDTMGLIRVERCLKQCIGDFRLNYYAQIRSSRNDLLSTTDPLQIAKRICANPTETHGAGPIRVDFTVPETNGSVTGHFIQSMDEPNDWGFRLFTEGTLMHTSELERQLYKTFGFKSEFKWLRGSYMEYALAVPDDDYTDLDIWDGIQDCSIWSSVWSNADAHVKAMKKITQEYNKKNGDAALGLDVDDGKITDLFYTKVVPEIAREMINPMFTAAAKAILDEKVAATGKVYMRASFTDLAIAA